MDENSFDDHIYDDKAIVFESEFEHQLSYLSAVILEGGKGQQAKNENISRERILKKLQHLSKWKLTNAVSVQNVEKIPNHVETLNHRPSAKILERLYTVPGNDNTYVSLGGDSLYQSLHNAVEDGAEDRNTLSCPVLVSSILAMQAELLRHQEMTG